VGERNVGDGRKLPGGSRLIGNAGAGGKNAAADIGSFCEVLWEELWGNDLSFSSGLRRLPPLVGRYRSTRGLRYHFYLLQRPCHPSNAGKHKVSVPGDRTLRELFRGEDSSVRYFAAPYPTMEICRIKIVARENSRATIHSLDQREEIVSATAPTSFLQLLQRTKGQYELPAEAAVLHRG